MNAQELITSLSNLSTRAERKAQGAGPWDEYVFMALDSLIEEARCHVRERCSICGVPEREHNDAVCREEYEG